VAQGGVFPAPGASPIQMPLTASITVASQPVTPAPTAVFELVAGEDPFFANVNPQQNNPFYLSQDLRVFAVTPGINSSPIQGVGVPPMLSPASMTAPDTGAGFQYIQSLLGYLNANYSIPFGNPGSNGDPFALFPDQLGALTGDSSVTPVTPNPANPFELYNNYNFAVARVRMTGPPNGSSINNVRVFFRLFLTLSNDADYDATSTYPSALDAAGLPGAPLLGTGVPPSTMPFFATGNLSANADFAANTDFSANSVNNQPIQLGSPGSVWAYYGCYLNVYPPLNTVNGQSVLSLLPGTHNCLVAQIAFDGAPIINSNGTTENPETSDKLAQRNLQITLSDNPGPPSTHRIPQTFDLRPSRALGGPGQLLDYPDELMIDWGSTPAGSRASIYWPQVKAADVLVLANELYSTHQLSAADTYTVQCKVPVRGVTWVPILPGTGQRYAGLFTIDLPPGGVSTGEEFEIIVRRIATRTVDVKNRVSVMGGVKAVAARAMLNWRYVVGTFGVRIPVTTSKAMLPPEEDTLAIMKWRLGQMTAGNRWYPVLERYISYISARVNGLGGSASSIMPSPYGAGPSSPGREAPREFTGKVVGIRYDRFGDFEGFAISSQKGHEHWFRGREHEVEELVRCAWIERTVISVFVESHDSDWPASIVLRRRK
jgi:hypothetical protein